MNHLVCACKKRAAQSNLLFHRKKTQLFTYIRNLIYKVCCIVAAMTDDQSGVSHLSFCTLFIRDLILIYLIAI